MTKPERGLTLASLPINEMLDRVRRGARAVVKDPVSLNPHFLELRSGWLNENIPHADGQTDDEFDELMTKACTAFDEAFDDEVTQHGKRLEYISTHVMFSLNELRSLHAVARSQLDCELLGNEDFIMLVRCVVERVGIRLEAAHEKTGEGRVGFFDAFGPVYRQVSNGGEHA